MSEAVIPLAAVAAAILAAALMAHRMDNEKRDVRLMAGVGGALGGVALTLFTVGSS